MTTGTEAARAATRRDDLRRRLRGTSGRARKLRGLIVLLAPYRTRVVLMFVALVAGTAASLAPAPLAKTAIDSGILKGDLETLDLVVVAFVVSALVVWAASYAQTYLVGWVGQRALADLRLQIFRHLQEMPVGFYERRPAGMLISRMTNDVEALDSLVTDTVVTLFQASLTLVGSVAILLYPRPPAGAADLPHLPGDGDRVAGLPHRQRRRVPAHPRDHQRHHRLPAGDAVGHPRRAQLRPGAAPPGALRATSTTSTAMPTSSRSTSTRPTSPPSSSSRPSPPSASSSSAAARPSTATSRSACSSASSPRSTASSTPSASCRRSTRPTSRAWRRSTRSSSCSTSRPS